MKPLCDFGLAHRGCHAFNVILGLINVSQIGQTVPPVTPAKGGRLRRGCFAAPRNRQEHIRRGQDSVRGGTGRRSVCSGSNFDALVKSHVETTSSELAKNKKLYRTCTPARRGVAWRRRSTGGHWPPGLRVGRSHSGRLWPRQGRPTGPEGHRWLRCSPEGRHGCGRLRKHARETDRPGRPFLKIRLR